MSAGFGFLSRFEFLQDWASAVIASMNPAAIHNLEKYHALKSDIHASAKFALTFCAPLLRQGGFIVLDDYFAYRGREDRGVRRAFREFLADSGLRRRHVFAYGMGDCVFVVSEAAHGAS